MHEHTLVAGERDLWFDTSRGIHVDHLMESSTCPLNFTECKTIAALMHLQYTTVHASTIVSTRRMHDE